MIDSVMPSCYSRTTTRVELATCYTIPSTIVDISPIHTADAGATQLCRRRRCVLNSQLVGDIVSTSLDESEQFADNEVELRRDGGVNAPVVSRDPVSNFLCQSHIGRRLVNWVMTADGCVHTADTTQLDSWVASTSAVCIGLNRHYDYLAYDSGITWPWTVFPIQYNSGPRNL